MNNEFARRRSVVAAELDPSEMDAFLVSSLANIRYLTGFTGSNGTLLVLPDDAILFTDPRYTIQSGREVSCKVSIVKRSLLLGVASALRRRRIRRLGFERAHLSYDSFDVLRNRLPANTLLEPVIGWVEGRRMLKSEGEIALIERSVATNSEAFEQAVKRLRLGMREQDLAAEIEYRMRRLGAEKPSFETIVASGERSAAPHAHPTSAAFQTQQLVLVDMGAFRDGYASDMTRMIFLGKPGARVKHAYKAVLEAQLAAIDAVRPGVTCGYVDRQARKTLKAQKLDKAFVHSTGHGLGLEIHELPRIGRKDKTPLQAGMAITIEPGVYLEGFGGIRIEDTAVVTETGCRILTPTSKELRVI